MLGVSTVDPRTFLALDASSNFGLGTSLTQAPSDALPADSSFQFTTQATVFYTCWVGDGVVQVCQFQGD